MARADRAALRDAIHGGLLDGDGNPYMPPIVRVGPNFKEGLADISLERTTILDTGFQRMMLATPYVQLLLKKADHNSIPRGDPRAPW